MPSIAKQHRVKKNKVKLKRPQRLPDKPKVKPFHPLCWKLKNNNNSLAKALSLQKQENQMLDSQCIELTKELQVWKSACNSRDMACANINHMAKELSALLDKAQDLATSIIAASGEFVTTPNRTSLLLSPVSNARKDSFRRLSMKSPARGVVKPMVSGHTITKPVVTLRRLDLYAPELSGIEEGSPRSADSSLNTTEPHTVGSTSTNRFGYEGEHRRRLPERIPLEYVGSDDDEGLPVPRTESRRSVGRFSGRLSNSFTRKRSGETAMGQIRSPRVFLCDVSKVLKDSQINLKQLKNSWGSNGDLSGLSNTPGDLSQHINDEDTPPTSYVTAREFQGVRRSLDETFNCFKVPRGGNESTKNATERSNNSEIDPIEGPSWLLNESEANRSLENATFEETVEIVRKKPPARQIESSDSEPEDDRNLGNETMEFTECINPAIKRLEIPISRLSHGENVAKSDVANSFLRDRAEDNSNARYSSITSSPTCADFSINRSTEFVTDRRRGYSHDDDDDDEPDTIMLQFSRGRKPKAVNTRFDINEFRLPVVHTPIAVPLEEPEDDREVTSTIRFLPGNCSVPNLMKDTVESRDSTLQLPRDEDDLKAKRQKRSTKMLQVRKNVKFSENDSSESDSAFESDKKSERVAEKKKSAKVKDPSSAKVVLEKLNNNDVRIRCGTPDLFEKSQDHNASNLRSSFEGRNSEPPTDSSTYSLTEPGRPRRQKAPRSLKEPPLGTKLRRNF